MHHPPPVHYPVGPPAGAALWGGALVVAVLASLGWGMQRLQVPAPWWGLGLLGAGGAWLAAAFWWRGQCRGLVSLVQGQAGWCLVADPELAQPGWVEVAFDGQTHLLLVFRPSAQGQPVRWLWLSRHRRPELWHLLRCAVYSRPVSGGLSGRDSARDPSTST